MSKETDHNEREARIDELLRQADRQARADAILCEALRAILRFERETAVMLGFDDPLPETLRSSAEPLDIPAQFCLAPVFGAGTGTKHPEMQKGSE